VDGRRLEQEGRRWYDASRFSEGIQLAGNFHPWTAFAIFFEHSGTFTRVIIYSQRLFCRCEESRADGKGDHEKEKKRVVGTRAFASFSLPDSDFSAIELEHWFMLQIEINILLGIRNEINFYLLFVAAQSRNEVTPPLDFYELNSFPSPPTSLPPSLSHQRCPRPLPPPARSISPPRSSIFSPIPVDSLTSTLSLRP